MRRPTLAEALLAGVLLARLAGCTPTERREAQTALEAAEAGCEMAEALALDPRAREACEASAAARKAADIALKCSADGGAP
jgi:hypothetical protein